jgi:hypothetical protein
MEKKILEQSVESLKEKKEKEVNKINEVKINEVFEPLNDYQPKRYIIRPEVYNEVVYEFRKARAEIESSAERIIRLAKIGMLINKMRAKSVLKLKTKK